MLSFFFHFRFSTPRNSVFHGETQIDSTLKDVYLSKYDRNDLRILQRAAQLAKLLRSRILQEYCEAISAKRYEEKSAPPSSCEIIERESSHALAYIYRARVRVDESRDYCDSALDIPHISRVSRCE